MKKADGYKKAKKWAKDKVKKTGGPEDYDPSRCLSERCPWLCSLLQPAGVAPAAQFAHLFSARACDDNLISQTNIMFVDH